MAIKVKLTYPIPEPGNTHYRKHVEGYVNEIPMINDWLYIYNSNNGLIHVTPRIRGVKDGLYTGTYLSCETVFNIELEEGYTQKITNLDIQWENL